ncbi:MAG: ATP-binding protein [Crocinitomicaceae bacterium]|nr:ATP-binding protein [Crocinitomicaceae bacterium]MBK8925701.1 ATP-binding protein [Crocinitomicaceae bacterium]
MNRQFNYTRALKAEAIETANEFKILCVTGPRQSGKTTFCKNLFKKTKYINLEDPDMAGFARDQPRKFLSACKGRTILDEVQRVPELFNYLQGWVDKQGQNGQFILTGSSNFLLQEGISQSLAGRVGYIELLPFSQSELSINDAADDDVTSAIFRGGYPVVVTGKTSAARWNDNYIKTYIEKDLRLLRNIGSLSTFNRFLRVCAGRASQLLNLSSIANEIGVDVKTIDAWISVLEMSYIVYRLPPYHVNFNKRVIKSPKLYFYDTGVLCHLLGIRSASALASSRHYGEIFENFIVTEIVKNRKNHEQSGDVFFFRDSVGNEVDVVIDRGDSLVPIEIKSARRINSGDLRGVRWFNRFLRQSGGMLLYGGKDEKSFDDDLVALPFYEVMNL